MEQVKKEIGKFLIVGFAAFTTDSLIYFFLLNFLSHSPAKAISFVCACVLAFILQKYWTFNFKGRSFTQMVKFAALNTTTLGANVAANKISLIFFPGFILFAFLAASGTSTVLNFIGQKWWVFRKRGANG